MLKGGMNTASLTNQFSGINISTSSYGKTVRLVYGLTLVAPDLVWYNDWVSHSKPSNAKLEFITGQSSTLGGKSKKSGKKSGQTPKFFQTSIDFLLGHAPMGGILSAWYGNQKLAVIKTSVTGVVSSAVFTFTPQAVSSRIDLNTTIPSTPPYQITLADWAAGLEVDLRYNLGFFGSGYVPMGQVTPGLTPSSREYSLTTSGVYTFAAADAGQQIRIRYFKFISGGTAGTLAGIYAVTLNEPFSATFDDFGGPGQVTMLGNWERPLWNSSFAAAGTCREPNAGHLFDPYTWGYDGFNPSVNFQPELNGKTVTIYYGVPVIKKSDGTVLGTTFQFPPIELIGLEFEHVFASGSEYTNHPDQQVQQNWVCGLGGVNFDLGESNIVPNINYEVIGNFTLYPNGDCDVADILEDIVYSGPNLVEQYPGSGGQNLWNLNIIPHGVNCNNFDNHGFLQPQFPPGNGVLIEDMTDIRAYCRANGITAALNQDSQRSAKDLIDELLTVSNTAAVFSGDYLKLIPYDEVSTAGNGAVYTSPTSSGPIADLTPQDFIFSQNESPITVVRKRRADCDNVVAIEFKDRSLDYAHNVTTGVDQVGVALFGPRKGGTLSEAELGLNVPTGSKALLTISDATVAQKVASVLAKKTGAGVNVYKFKLKAEWFMLEAMDLVTITDVDRGINKQPVRLTLVEEQDDKSFSCEADEFMYGLNHPDVVGVGLASGTLVDVNVDPGLVDQVVIFEPTLAMSTVNQLAFAVNGADQAYGGCAVFMSTDGGTTYDNFLGTAGPAIMGILTADFPNVADPDTTSTLSVDLTDARGILTTNTNASADDFKDVCYVSTPTTFEFIAPTVATMTAQYKYDLTGYKRRGILGTTPLDHIVNSKFISIDGNILSYNLPANLIGRTLFFKFAAFNQLGGQQNQLSDCVPYTYTPAGH